MLILTYYLLKYVLVRVSLRSVEMWEHELHLQCDRLDRVFSGWLLPVLRHLCARASCDAPFLGWSNDDDDDNEGGGRGEQRKHKPVSGRVKTTGKASYEVKYSVDWAAHPGLHRIYTRAGVGSRLLEFHRIIMRRMIVSVLLLSVLTSGEPDTHTHTHIICSVQGEKSIHSGPLKAGQWQVSLSPVERVRIDHVTTVDIVPIKIIQILK